MNLEPISNRAIEIFFSYAREDRVLRDALVKQLSSMTQQGLIQSWGEWKISAGSDSDVILGTYLDTSDIILLLISPDFIASEYCRGVEMNRAMERHELGDARVIPIILRPADWLGLPFAKLSPLPANGKAVTLWHNKDAAFFEIAKGIRRVVEELTTRIRGESTQKGASIWNVPYRRNPFFTGRENILANLHNIFTVRKASTAPVQALSGLGGIGKTQIAVEYAYRYQSEYHAILWVKANSKGDLLADVVSLAEVLNLVEQNEPDQSLVVDAVKRWLQNHSKWLLILDNIVDLGVVDDFIPSIPKGHILITTRSQATGPLANSIAVEKMEPEEGSLFLLRRAKIIMPNALQGDTSQTNYITAMEISRIIDGLPLALDQAGAYIEETRKNLGDYLNLYRRRRDALLRRRGRFSIDHPESVTTTFSLSFEKVESANPAAADLLRFCVFLHPDTIPEEIFSEGSLSLGLILQPLAEDPIRLDEAIEELLKYSLIRRNSDSKTLSIHRLVQAVLKDAMPEEQQREWAERAVLSVNRILQDVTYETWPLYQRYFTQVQVSIDLINQWKMEFQEVVRLLYLLGTYMYERALLIEAEPLLLQALETSKRILSTEHIDTARCLMELGRLYHVQGKYKEAESLLTQALAIRQQVLGLEHSDVAESLSLLGVLYRVQGEYKEAEPLLLHALAIREQMLGPEHPDTAQSLNDLAHLYRIQSKYPEAESLYKRALTIRKQLFGSEHPETADSLNGLAFLYRIQGRYADAELLYQQSLEFRERVLGQEHPDTATSLNNLAFLYYTQGKYAEAEPLYLRALTIREKILGMKHPEMAASLNNLGILYEDQGDYAKAELFYKQALSIREQAFGAEHPSTAQSLNNLAYLFRVQGKYTEAESLFQRALLIRERILGLRHPDTAQSMSNLGYLYCLQSQYALAESLLQRALAIREQILGPEHPDTTITLNNLAELYFVQERYTDAEPLYQRILASREQAFGPDHPAVADSLDNLAKLYYKQGKYADAKPLYERALIIYQKILGAEHPKVSNMLENYPALSFALKRDN